MTDLPDLSRPEPADPVPPVRVGVFPRRTLETHARLLGALEAALPVRFEDGERASGVAPPPGALLALGADGAELLAACSHHGPAGPAHLIADRPEVTRSGVLRAVVVGDDPALAPALRGARLSDRRIAELDPERAGAAELRVLARASGRPVWALTADGMGHRVGALPAELGPEEPLRDRLAPGRGVAMLALVHFLREVCGMNLPTPTPVRAAFLFDDPNLHWPSYGHLHFRRLAHHAAAHGYHVSVALIPRDAWPAHPGAVAAFRESQGRLSLCMHGNDHFGAELGRRSGVGADLRQALRRIDAFEGRTGLSVDRVMVPPHERLSRAAASALAALPFDAVCVTRPYPWLVETLETPWLTAPPAAGHLSGWSPGPVLPGGLPGLLRTGFATSDEELALRAFLGQPVILYGHHDALADGLDLLADRAAAVNRLGEVRWGSLAAAARGAAELRLTGAALEVRMLGRRIDFRSPQGIRRLRIDARAVATSESDRVMVGWRTAGEWDELPACAPSSIRATFRGSVEARLLRPAEGTDADPAGGGRTLNRLDPRPGVRRGLGEVRDRLPAGPRRRPRLRLRPRNPRGARTVPPTRPRVLLLVENGSVPADRRVWAECRTLAGAGLEVHVICPQGTRAGEQAAEELREGIHIHRFRARFSGEAGALGYLAEYAWALGAIALRVRRLTRQAPFAVVHAANPPDLLLLAAGSMRRAGTRRIFDHHDLVPELVEARFGAGGGIGRRVLVALTRAAERSAYRRADAVVVTNASYAKVAQSRGGVAPDRIVIVRNGPDLDRFTPVDPDPGLARGSSRLLAYVGIMGPQDGVEEALEALALLAERREDWHAVFGGTGSAREGLIARAAELGLAERVEFPGWLGDLEIRRLLCSADVCLAPEPPSPFNHASTMIKVMEYMAMARPIVAFDLVESRASAGPAALYAADRPGFAACLEALLDDPERARQMGEAGRIRVQDQLAWQHSAAALRRLYAGLLAPRWTLPGLAVPVRPPTRRDPDRDHSRSSP